MRELSDTMLEPYDHASDLDLTVEAAGPQRNVMALGQILGKYVHDSIKIWSDNRPRTKQAETRVLGMSDLGGCREFIRATVAGDPKTPEVGLKWAADVGTMVGDGIETAVMARGVDSTVDQTRVTLKLIIHGQEFFVSGSGDLIFTEPILLDDGTVVPPGVVDLKTKDGLETVRRSGPTFKESCQIAGYFVACVQEGLLDPDQAIATLLYVDRSGSDNTPHTWTCSYEQALLILEAAKERLESVVDAMATGVTQSYLRDEPESWCHNIQCPFRKACWEGYQPTDKVEHPREIQALAAYVAANEEEKAVKKRKLNARNALLNVEGIAPDGTSIKWTTMENGSTRIDVRPPR